MTPLRKKILRVGLATQTSTKQAESPLPSHDDYDARIMHRAVPATLQTVTVLVDANDYQIARALRLDPRDVRTSWITSRTPVIDPRPSPVPTRPHACATFVERRYRHAPMVPIQVLQKYRDMAVLLRQRLSTIQNAESNSRTPISSPPVQCEQNDSSTVPSIVPSSAESCVGSYEPASVMCPPFASKCCSFSHCGKRIRFNADDNRSVVRTKGGLYSGARHAQLLRRGDSAYIEFDFSSDTDLSGVAVGVATEKYGIDTMVGAKPGSMALHSQPKFVVGGQWDDPQREIEPLRASDTVGLMISLSKSRVVMRTAVNGVFVGEMTGDDTLCKAVDDGLAVQVMVSMFRSGTSVRVNCCPTEWKYSPAKIWGRNLTALCAPKTVAKNSKQILVAVDDMSAVLTP